jgi:hypothetical protein
MHYNWHHIATLAKKHGAKYPMLVAAQWALESGWGKSIVGNNPFGLKGSNVKAVTTEYVNGKPRQVLGSFLKFYDIEEAVRYLVDHWYKDYRNGNNTYRGVNNAKNRNAAAWQLVHEGFATDPAYATKLIDIMEKNCVPIDLDVKAMSKEIKLADAAKWYNSARHQEDAWKWLEGKVDKNVMDEFARRYRNSLAKENSRIIDCPYFYQRDSKTGHGERSCQSSAIAMVVKYIDPGLIEDDDDYLKLVFKHGDTVSQAAHGKALDDLGLEHRFTVDADLESIFELLDINMPVPCGILHKGPISNPSGGGHYVTIIGYTKDDFIVHDPFGKLDLVKGRYVATGPTDGKSVRYRKDLFEKRWAINSKNDGWMWDLGDNYE